MRVCNQIDRSSATNRMLNVVAMLYLVFVVYGSWVPLHFVPLPFAGALQTFLVLPFYDQAIGSATDWATNFILLIPLAFLCAQRLLPSRQGGTRQVFRLLIIFIGILLAFLLEFSQLYFPTRTVSQKDILALSLGAFVGVVAQHKWGNSVEGWLILLWQNESGQTRLIQLLHVYLMVFFVFSVLPLDLTISLVEVYHKWTEGRVVLTPFDSLKGGMFENIYEIATDLLIWVPVGLFLALDRRSSLITIAGFAWLAAAIVETAQLFVYSRVTDITDVLLAGFGAAIGACLAVYSTKPMELLAETRTGFWYSIWCVWALSILSVFWFPYNFQRDGASFETAWAALSRVPFFMLYQGSEFQAVNEMLRKFGFFLPGGIFWGVALHQSVGKNGKSTKVGWLALISLACVVESGQLFLPQKFSDITDVLIMAFGGVFGLKISQWVLSGYATNNWALAKASHRELRFSKSDPVCAQKGAVSVLKWNHHLVTLIGVIIAVGTITRLSFVPYNIKELIEPGLSGIFSVIGISLVIQWLVNGHFLYLLRCSRLNGEMLYLPLWLIAHAAATWTLLRLSVPLESIHDIVGSPILGWGWEWELIGRYLALHAAIALQSIGAITLLTVLCRKCRLETFLIWVGWSIVMAWPLHWVVVTQAATDNLTELMRDGGTFASSSVLAIGLLSFFFAGAVISNFFATRLNYFWVLLLAGGGVFLSVLCFWFGSEQVIVKYGKIFSAWQFVLSTNRDNYLVGERLYLHFALAFWMLLGFYSLVQTSFWQMLAIGKGVSE